MANFWTIFEPQPCNFVKLDIFEKCLNDNTTSFCCWQTWKKRPEAVYPGNPKVHVLSNLIWQAFHDYHTSIVLMFKIEKILFSHKKKYCWSRKNSNVLSSMKALSYLHNYFDIHVCLSLRCPSSRHVPLPIFIRFRVPEAQSDRCWARRSRATYTQF